MQFVEVAKSFELVETMRFAMAKDVGHVLRRDGFAVVMETRHHATLVTVHEPSSFAATLNLRFRRPPRNFAYFLKVRRLVGVTNEAPKSHRVERVNRPRIVVAVFLVGRPAKVLRTVVASKSVAMSYIKAFVVIAVESQRYKPMDILR